MNKVTITRRSRFQAIISYSPGTPDLSVASPSTVTAKQFVREYWEMRAANPNAAVFVHIYKNGQLLAARANDIMALADGVVDNLSLDIVA